MTKEPVTPDMITKLDLDPNVVLAAAIGNLSEVVVLGFEKETGDFYLASSEADAMRISFLFARGQHTVMKKVDELEGNDS